LAGAGKSINALFTILIKGCWVRNVDIKPEFVKLNLYF
jgi:hypothetical protein